jgi:hypothetical protein
MDPLPRPAEGYPAIRFVEPLTIPGPLGVYVPSSGTVLVADRAKAGRPLYCGTVLFRDLAAQAVPVCATYDGGMLTMSADKPLRRAPFQVPPGAIEEFRLR